VVSLLGASPESAGSGPVHRTPREATPPELCRTGLTTVGMGGAGAETDGTT
jgi:hypothetical protein